MAISWLFRVLCKQSLLQGLDHSAFISLLHPFERCVAQTIQGAQRDTNAAPIIGRVFAFWVQVFADRDYAPYHIKLLPMTTAMVFTPINADKSRSWQPNDAWLVVGAALPDGRTMYATPSTVMPEKKSETDRTAKKSARQPVMEPFWCLFFWYALADQFFLQARSQ